MKKNLLLAFSLFFFVNSLSAQIKFDVENYMILPPVYYVGDQAQLIINIKSEHKLEIVKPEKMPKLSWIEIYEIIINEESKSEYKIRILFKSFHPGTRTFPELDLGDISLKDIKIHTASVLDEEAVDFYPIKDPIFLPGTQLLIALVAALILLGPLFFILMPSFIKKKISIYISERKKRQPMRKISKILKELNLKLESIASKEFYIRLINSLKIYISSVTNIDFATNTTNELNNLMQNEFHFMEDSSELIRLLKFSDEVKFGGKGSTVQQRQRDSKAVELIVDEIHHFFNSSKEKKEKKDKNESNIKRGSNL